MVLYDKKSHLICIAIAIDLPIVFAEIVNVANNNHLHTSLPPPLTKSWLRAFTIESIKEVYRVLCRKYICNWKWLYSHQRLPYQVWDGHSCFLPTRWHSGIVTQSAGRSAGRSWFESRVEVMLAKNLSSWCEGKLPNLPFLTKKPLSQKMIHGVEFGKTITLGIFIVNFVVVKRWLDFLVVEERNKYINSTRLFQSMLNSFPILLILMKNNVIHFYQNLDVQFMLC